MNATTKEALLDPAKAPMRGDLPVADDPTEDLFNEVTSELNPPQRWPRPVARPPIAHGIAEIEPIGVADFVGSGTVLRERYVLERQLANGGTAMIFRAHDLRRDAASPGGPRVAVKLLHPELRSRPHHISRLQREFRQTQALPHPNVVRFHDLDCDRGVWFIVMELLHGETLGPRLRRHAPEPLPFPEALRIVGEAGEALAFAHERGVVHGDIKPDNIFVTQSGGVRVLDFGVSPDEPRGPAAGDAPVPESVAAAATRAYASPEVLRGERPDPRDDVFSLACVAYEALSGRHPWGRRGADEAEASAVRIDAPPGLAPARWTALAEALAWKRDSRPALRAFLSSLRAGASPAAAGSPVAAAALAQPAPPDEVAPTPDSGTAVTVPADVTRVPPAAAGDAARLRWKGMAAVAIAFLVGVAISFIGREQPDSAPAAAPLPPVAGPPAASADAPPREDSGPAAAQRDERVAEVAAPGPVVAPPRTPRTPPGFVAFESEAMAVSSRAVVAAIPVRHFASDRRGVEVTWRVLDGSAVAGRDYGGAQSGVARFAEGHTFRMIFVPITIDTSTVGERTFAVELTGVSAGAELGGMRRVLVTIQDDA